MLFLFKIKKKSIYGNGSLKGHATKMVSSNIQGISKVVLGQSSKFISIWYNDNTLFRKFDHQNLAD